MSRFEARQRWHVGLDLRASHASKHAEKEMVLYKVVVNSWRDMIPHIEYSWVGKGALFIDRATADNRNAFSSYFNNL